MMQPAAPLCTRMRVEIWGDGGEFASLGVCMCVCIGRSEFSTLMCVQGAEGGSETCAQGYIGVRPVGRRHVCVDRSSRQLFGFGKVWGWVGFSGVVGWYRVMWIRGSFGFICGREGILDVLVGAIIRRLFFWGV